MRKWIVAGKLFTCEKQAQAWAGKIYQASGVIVAVEEVAVVRRAFNDACWGG